MGKPLFSGMIVGWEMIILLLLPLLSTPMPLERTFRLLIVTGLVLRNENVPHRHLTFDRATVELSVLSDVVLVWESAIGTDDQRLWKDESF